MNKILSQAELDALLQTVSPPPMDPNQELAQGSNQIAEGEEKSTLERKGVSGAGTQGKKVTVYDFRRPDRVSKSLIHSLHLLHDKFCTNISASLSAYLRTVTEVSLRSVEQSTYAEFVGSLGDPTSMNAVNLRPLNGAAVLEVNLDLAFPIIDRLLGGPGHSPGVKRNITEIEKNILQGVLQMITSNLTEAWRPVTEVNFHLYSSETRPQLLQVIPSNEVVILFIFDVKLGEVQGVFHVCIPYSSLEPVRGKFDQETEIAPKGNRQEDQRKLVNALRKVPVAVSVELPRSKIAIRDLMSLKVHDILCMDIKISENVLLYVAGKPKFQGQLMAVNDRKAVKVLGGRTRES
ncbi:MAG: flagellar motor switch protein FliM [Terriglobia bacterium]